MTARKRKQEPQPQKKKASASGKPVTGKDTRTAAKALPRAARRPETGRPEEGSGQGRVDVTGIMPEGIHVDPDLTEGHPGYEESGDSEIIPTERLSGGQAAKEKESRG